MDRRKLILMLASLVVAIVAALAARSMFTAASAPVSAAAPLPAEGPRVLVAGRALPVGTIITADSLTFRPWPQEVVQNAYYVEGEADVAALVGTVVRHPVTAGEPVTRGSLVAPGDRGFLAAALGPGMRAVTITVSAGTGVAGFVFPGDRIDLVLTQTIEGDGRDLKASETIIRNLRVLATDQSTETSSTSDGKTVVKAFSMVTLEVTPVIAEKIAVAQTIGTLSLSLRSIADSAAELERAVAASEVELPDGISPEQEEELLRQAMARPRHGPSTYQTGGDVSRFQRRTMPPARGTLAPSVQPGTTMRETMAQPPAQTTGPVVRVSRGNLTVETPVERAGASR